MASIRKILGIIGGFLVTLSGEPVEARGPDAAGEPASDVTAPKAQAGASPLSREQLERPFQMATHVNSGPTEERATPGAGVIKGPVLGGKKSDVPAAERLPDLQQQGPGVPGEDAMGAIVVPNTGGHLNSGPTGHKNAPGHADFSSRQGIPQTGQEQTPAVERLPGMQHQAPAVPGEDAMGAHVLPHQNASPPPHGTPPHTNSGPAGHQNTAGHTDFSVPDHPGTSQQQMPQLDSKGIRLSDPQRDLESEAGKARQESEKKTGQE